MGIDFWAGILIGFSLSVVFWFFTTKWLVARLRVLGNAVEESKHDDGTFRYRFLLNNIGHRDAVDVTVTCTLFSTGWCSDPRDLIATIAVPVSVGRINVMPGRSWLRSITREHRAIDMLGPRVITLKLDEITDFQKSKLEPGKKTQLEDRELRLVELMELGDDSFLSVTVYAYDSFSGARSVYTHTAIRPSDIRRVN